jgi:hypothetical protein
MIQDHDSLALEAARLKGQFPANMSPEIRTPMNGVRRDGRAAAPSVAADVPNLYDVQRQIDEYIRSGRYDVDVSKVVAAARAWLEERATTAVKPAIVYYLP